MRAFSEDCFVAGSREILEDAEPVLVMIRQKEGELELDELGYGFGPGQITGWVLLTGEEKPDDLVDGRSALQPARLGPILERDPSLAPWLETPAHCVLARENEGEAFERLE